MLTNGPFETIPIVADGFKQDYFKLRISAQPTSKKYFSSLT